ncbi:MAG: hypothetical protein DMF82_17630 [Acidobacteria bacterium]|nr:MAG: hypothetical protein DMF82_17630 [Acidobacteriota bacterium]
MAQHRNRVVARTQVVGTGQEAAQRGLGAQQREGVSRYPLRAHPFFLPAGIVEDHRPAPALKAHAEEVDVWRTRFPEALEERV